jgi:hypothetical protein
LNIYLQSSSNHLSHHPTTSFLAFLSFHPPPPPTGIPCSALLGSLWSSILFTRLSLFSLSVLIIVNQV